MARGSSAVAAVALIAALAACGRSTSPDAAHAGQAAAAAARTAPRSSDSVDPDMVSAVSPGGSTTPIGMKFRLQARPVVGSPLRITVALIPATNVEITHIHADFQPSEGLQLQSGRTLDINDPRSGVAFEQEVTVLPQQSGVLSLGATVVVDQDSGSIARTYTIPLIARDGTP